MRAVSRAAVAAVEKSKRYRRATKAVARQLAWRAEDDSGHYTSYAGVKRYATDLGLSRSVVDRAMRDLTADGFRIVLHQCRNGPVIVAVDLEVLNKTSPVVRHQSPSRK